MKTLTLETSAMVPGHGASNLDSSELSTSTPDLHRYLLSENDDDTDFPDAKDVDSGDHFTL